MAIIVVPGLFMLVVAVFRGDSLKSRLYIVVCQARLVFGGRDSGGRADVEKRNDAIFDAGCGHRVADLSGNVANISIAFCSELYCLRFDHFRLSLRNEFAFCIGYNTKARTILPSQRIVYKPQQGLIRSFYVYPMAVDLWHFAVKARIEKAKNFYFLCVWLLTILLFRLELYHKRSGNGLGSVFGR